MVTEPAGTTAQQAAGANWADEPIAKEHLDEVRPKLKLARDKRGRYLAYVPQAEWGIALLAGDSKTFYVQHIGFRTSNATTFDYRFFEPRARGLGGGTNLTLERDQVLRLTCGMDVAVFEPVPEAEAKKILDAARLLRPRWRRTPVALAKDEGSGTYYYVDIGGNEKGVPKDVRMHVGKAGHFEVSPVTSATHELRSAVYTTEAGHLKVTGFGKNAKAEWVAGGKHTPLKWMPHDENVRFIYTELGVYAGEKLGTACDAVFELKPSPATPGAAGGP